MGPLGYNGRMKVIYDARWLRLDGRFDGVSRYSSELARELVRQPGIDITWMVYDARQLEQLPDGPHLIVNNPSDFAREMRLPKLLNQQDVDAVYSPFFIMGTSGHRYKLVLTIHDLIYFTHRTPPHWLPPYVRLGWRLYHLSHRPMRWLLNQADAIATVSDTVGDELRAAHATRRPIVTVRNAVSQDFRSKFATEHYQSNSVVYMGAFTQYKNVECLIDALPLLPEVTLHLLSPMPTARRKSLEKRMRDRRVLGRIVIHDGVSDQKYKELLSQSRCLVSASKLEGFGLNNIEAQQYGVPVACSDTPIFHETGGDSVLYFNPNSPAECADAIKKLADKSTSQKLIKLGHQNVARFNWQESARIAADICRKLV